MDKKGTQSISCSVESCKYYEQNESCGLSGIHVTPLSSVVNTPEESMCQSFERKSE